MQLETPLSFQEDAESGPKEYPFFPKPEDFVPETHFSASFHKLRKRNTPRCLAWSRQNGRQCESSPMQGRTTCRMHGGESPRGLANSSTRTGLYSKYLPLRMRARFEDLINADDLYDLRNTVALLDTRTLELFEKFEGKDLETVEKAFNEFKAVFVGYDREAGEAFLHLGQVIQQNKQAWQIWEEVRDLAEQKRRVVETDRRTQIQAEKLYSLAEVGIILGQVSAIIAQVVFQYVEGKLAGKIIEDTNRKFESLFKARE